MSYVLQQILNALQLGSIYALIALGYTLVYGILSMINFAHGDVFMVGAFVLFVAAVLLHLPFAPAMVLAILACALLGIAIERVAYKPLRNAPRVSSVITALGVGLMLEHITLAICPYPQHVPTLIRGEAFRAFGFTFSSLQLLIIGVSLALMLALDWMARRTLIGLAIRGIAWDRITTSLMGVPVNAIISFTFALGAGLGGAAGALYALAYPVIDPYMGIMVGWKAFISAVVGGIGNMRGAMLGGFILGGVEILAAAVLPSTYRDIIAFGLLFILLLVRPHGLLGSLRGQKV